MNSRQGGCGGLPVEFQESTCSLSNRTERLRNENEYLGSGSGCPLFQDQYPTEVLPCPRQVNQYPGRLNDCFGGENAFRTEEGNELPSVANEGTFGDAFHLISEAVNHMQEAIGTMEIKMERTHEAVIDIADYLKMQGNKVEDLEKKMGALVERLENTTSMERAPVSGLQKACPPCPLSFTTSAPPLSTSSSSSDRSSCASCCSLSSSSTPSVPSVDPVLEHTPNTTIPTLPVTPATSSCSSSCSCPSSSSSSDPLIKTEATRASSSSSPSSTSSADSAIPDRLSRATSSCGLPACPSSPSCSFSKSVSCSTSFPIRPQASACTSTDAVTVCTVSCQPSPSYLQPRRRSCSRVMVCRSTGMISPPPPLRSVFCQTPCRQSRSSLSLPRPPSRSKRRSMSRSSSSTIPQEMVFPSLKHRKKSYSSTKSPGEGCSSLACRFKKSFSRPKVNSETISPSRNSKIRPRSSRPSNKISPSPSPSTRRSASSTLSSKILSELVVPSRKPRSRSRSSTVSSRSTGVKLRPRSSRGCKSTKSRSLSTAGSRRRSSSRSTSLTSASRVRKLSSPSTRSRNSTVLPSFQDDCPCPINDLDSLSQPTPCSTGCFVTDLSSSYGIPSITQTPCIPLTSEISDTFSSPSCPASSLIKPTPCCTIPSFTTVCSSAATPLLCTAMPSPKILSWSCHERFAKLGIKFLKAAQEGRTRIVRKLLDEGVEVNFTFSSKWTALHRASRMGHADIVLLLIDRGADVHARTTYNFTALHVAAYYDYSGRCVELLIDAGSDVGSRNRSGRTPLHYAAEFGNAAAVRALISAGACNAVKDKRGVTPYDVANSECIRILLCPNSL